MPSAAHFEVYPQQMLVRGSIAYHPVNGVIETPHEQRPTGEFGWRFRAANGQITAIGGEGFTREEDAERALEEFCDTVKVEGAGGVPTILRVDE